MERFWPGGLTMVFFAGPILPRSLTAGTWKIGVRLSSHPVPISLQGQWGHTDHRHKCNRSGEPPCSTAEEVMEALGEDIDLILDGGKTPGRKGSTVLDVTTDPPVVVRRRYRITRCTLGSFWFENAVRSICLWSAERRKTCG